jgi:hypothetical protein
VNIITAVVASSQTPELMQPSQGALNYPTEDPKPAAVFGVAFG